MLRQDDLQSSFPDRRARNEGGLQGDSNSGNRCVYHLVTVAADHFPGVVAATALQPFLYRMANILVYVTAAQLAE